MKKKLLSIAQLFLGIAIIVFIIYNIPNREDLLIAIQEAAQHWPYLLAGVFCFLGCIIIVTIRWCLLLRAQSVTVSFSRAFVLYIIGHFFNSFLLGATGGDVVKAFYVAKEFPDKKAESVATVFVDRIMGLLGLLTLTVIMMAFRFRFFMQSRETKIAMAFNAFLLISALLFLFAVFRRNLVERSSLIRRLENKTNIGAKIGSILTRVYNAFHTCLNKPMLLVTTGLLSILNHVVLISMAFFFGRALAIKLSFIDYLSVFPTINAIAAIPVTPGALGTREAACKFFLGAMCVPETRAIPLSLLIYVGMFIWSLVGGIIYLCNAAKQGFVPDSASEDDK